MTKSIKIDDQVHKDLEELRFKRETFSQEVARMIQFYRDITNLIWKHTTDHTGHPETRDQGVTKPGRNCNEIVNEMLTKC